MHRGFLIKNLNLTSYGLDVPYLTYTISIKLRTQQNYGTLSVEFWRARNA